MRPYTYSQLSEAGEAARAASAKSMLGLVTAIAFAAAIALSIAFPLTLKERDGRISDLEAALDAFGDRFAYDNPQVPAKFGKYEVGQAVERVYQNDLIQYSGASKIRFGGLAMEYVSSAANAPRELIIDILYPITPGTGVNRFTTWHNASESAWNRAGLPLGWEKARIAGGKRFPVLVTSHGFLAGSANYLEQAYKLATHGIITAMPRIHPEDYDPTGNSAFTANNVAATNFAIKTGIGLRARDNSDITSKLLAWNADPSHYLFQGINSDAILINGISRGGGAAISALTGIADYGGDPTLPTELHSNVSVAYDSRYKGFIAMDPVSFHFNFSQLSYIKVPTLIFASHSNTPNYGEQRLFAAVANETKYILMIRNSVHATIAANGFCAVNQVRQAAGINVPNLTCQLYPLLREIANDLMVKYIVAFVETYFNSNRAFSALFDQAQGRQDNGLVDFQSARHPQLQPFNMSADFAFMRGGTAFIQCTGTSFIQNACIFQDGVFNWTRPFFGSEGVISTN